MRQVFVCLALFIPAVVLRADVVYFRGGASLECDVVKVTETSVTVRVSKGLFTFPKARVRRIEYAYEKKRKMLGEKDYRGHYDLGVWCIQCGQEENALKQFLYVEGKPGVPDEVYLRIADIYLAEGDKEKAAAYFKKYLATHPDDELIRKKIEELTAEEKKEEGGAKSGSAPSPAGKSTEEGVEILPRWVIEKWANPGTVTIGKTVEDKVENKILKVEYKAKNSDKTAIRLQYRTDLSGKKACVMDIYNPEKCVVSVAIAFVTSPGFNWYESKCRLVNPGWNLGVRFDLTGKDFKAKETGWRFSSPLKHRENVVQFIILVYNGTRTGTIFFDYIRFE